MSVRVTKIYLKYSLESFPSIDYYNMDLSDGTTVDFLTTYDYSEIYPLDAEIIAARQKEINDEKQRQFDYASKM